MAVKALPLIVTCLLLGCGLDQPISRPSDGEAARARVDKRERPTQAQWLFKKPLKGLSSREHYIVDVQFREEVASFTVHSHFNGFEWRDGVMVRVRRDGLRVFVEMGTPDFNFLSHEMPADFMSADARVRLRMEIHDGVAAGARVLIWNELQSRQGRVENPRAYILEGNADMDSGLLRWVFGSQGRGAQWGLETEGAELLHARREAPYVP